VLTQEPWEVVRIPAIAEEDEQHRAETVFGRQCFGRREGEVLHPERRPPLMLEQIRRTLGEYNFAGQYQQSPSPMGGGMVKAVWFRGYAPNERPEEFDHVCRAGTAHVLRKRMEYPELKRGICEQCEAFNASVVLIEDKASGNPADPGTGRAQPARGHPLPAAIGQDHADARPDRGAHADAEARTVIDVAPHSPAVVTTRPQHDSVVEVYKGFVSVGEWRRNTSC
jgi:hypothetical protein